MVHTDRRKKPSKATSFSDASSWSVPACRLATRLWRPKLAAPVRCDTSTRPPREQTALASHPRCSSSSPRHMTSHLLVASLALMRAAVVGKLCCKIRRKADQHVTLRNSLLQAGGLANARGDYILAEPRLQRCIVAWRYSGCYRYKRKDWRRWRNIGSLHFSGRKNEDEAAAHWPTLGSCRKTKTAACQYSSHSSHTRA